jgi:ribosomal protein S18 acetylase RimI-like enzyme
MSIRIVDGTRSHAALIAWVCLAAARSHLPRGFWDYYLDADDGECLKYLEALVTSTRPHLFHYSAFVVAEVSGRPAAALCGYFEEELGFQVLGAVMPEVERELGRTPELAQQGMGRMGPFLSLTPEHPPRAWIVENAATLPEFRRMGLVSRLLDAVLERGRSRGANLADIGVLISNDPAQLAYEKAGFRAVSEKRSAKLERTWGSPGLRLLRREY